jgi:TPR repeat protein
MTIVWAVLVVCAGVMLPSAQANGQTTSTTDVSGTASAPETIQDLRNAADAGNADAMFNIGCRYANGEGVAQDDQQAMTWYLKSAALGNSDAMYNVGVSYNDGRGVAQDCRVAMAWYLKAVDAGNLGAMNNIGLLYANGQGVAQDYAQAMICYRKTADAGDSVAMYNIGLLYANGQGVSQDYSQAMTWFSKAANAGDANAMYGVGVLYANGQGVARDDQQALVWYRKAANAGNQDAKKCLDELTVQDNSASPIDKISWTVGPAHIRVGTFGQLDLPSGYRFADSQQAALFETATQNPHDPNEIGVIVPPAGASTDPNTFWYVMLTYKDVGHVDDSEKDNLDDTTAGQILDAIRTATDKDNLERSRKGWAPLKIAGWDQRPFYDPVTHDLAWAIRASCALPGGNGDVTNYENIILGRSGFIGATLAIPPVALTAAVPNFQMLVKQISFAPGQTYEDFQPGDKVSNYGLTALITGGTAVAIAKGWPVAILFAKKLILAIGAIFAAAVAKIKSVFKRKSSQQTVAAQ